jgi:hypothetical protein
VDYELDMTPWIDSFLQNECKEETLQNLLHMMSEVTGAVFPTAASKLQELLQKFGYKVQVAELDKHSKCVNCGTKMAGITDEEYNKCKQIVHDRVWMRSDPFVNSNPVEMRDFIRLINYRIKNGPYYDLVIDGLNVAHVTQPFKLSIDLNPKHEGRIVKVTKSRQILVDNLTAVINNALRFNRRILLIGRNHMKSWRGLGEFLLSKKSQIDVFYLDNLSNDDPFIIYAAMQSPKTYVMSNDYFRDHKFLIDDHLFERWLRSRVIRSSRDGCTYAAPPKHETRINYSPNWRRLHIPVGYNSTSFITWNCCNKEELGINKK